MTPLALLLLISALASGCGDDGVQPDAGPGDAGPGDAGPSDAGPPRDAMRCVGPHCFVPDAAYEYDWACTGEIAPALEPIAAPAPPDDCTTGIWPALDPLVAACPTVTDAMRVDPVSGLTLPPAGDDRTLPIEIPVTESDSFLPPGGPASYPATLRVVAWNVEYTADLDAQIDLLTTRAELRDADVYLLSEVDRCSTRNGVRRAARLLAERLAAEYVYGIEFVELSIDRTVGGDTGQAIVSRRPITSAELLCHSSQSDWFASPDEPRLGQRVALHADIPVGDGHVRVYAVHFESNDPFGENRAKQVKELLDAAQRLACERPQIVAGDFNAWFPEAPEMALLTTAGFTDALLPIDGGPTHRSGRRLDYVFTHGFEVTGGGILRDVMASDHYPVWVTLVLR